MPGDDDDDDEKWEKKGDIGFESSITGKSLLARTTTTSCCSPLFCSPIKI